MRRLAICLFALALLAAACGDSGEVAEVAVVPAGEGIALAYGYASQPGADYRFGMTLDMVANMEGLGAAMGAPDGPVKMGVDAAGNLSYAFAPGTEEGTTEITLGVDIDGLDIREMTMGGESMADMIPADEMDTVFDAEGFVPEMTVVVDDHGKVLSLSYGDEALPAELLGGDLFSGGGLPGGNVGPEMLFGPQFPAEKLAVGSTWTVEESRDLGFGDPVATRTDYAVRGTEEVRGRTLWVIEGTTTMDPVELDLMDLMGEMASEDEMAGMEGMDEAFASMMGEMDMRFVITPQPTTSTTWFDAERGMVVKTFGEAAVYLEMEMAMMGEEMKVNMNMDMSMVLELQDTPAS